MSADHNNLTSGNLSLCGSCQHQRSPKSPFPGPSGPHTTLHRALPHPSSHTPPVPPAVPPFQPGFPFQIPDASQCSHPVFLRLAFFPPGAVFAPATRARRPGAAGSASGRFSVDRPLSATSVPAPCVKPDKEPRQGGRDSCAFDCDAAVGSGRAGRPVTGVAGH